MAHTHTYRNAGTRHFTSVYTKTLLTGTPAACALDDALCVLNGASLVTLTQPNEYTTSAVDTGSAGELPNHTHTVNIIVWSGGVVSNIVEVPELYNPVPHCGSFNIWLVYAHDVPMTATITEVNTSSPVVVGSYHYHTFTGITGVWGGIILGQAGLPTTCAYGHANCLKAYGYTNMYLFNDSSTATVNTSNKTIVLEWEGNDTILDDSSTGHIIEINKLIEHHHPGGTVGDIVTGNDVAHGDRVNMNLGWYHNHGESYPTNVYMGSMIGNWPEHVVGQHEA